MGHGSSSHAAPTRRWYTAAWIRLDCSDVGTVQPFLTEPQDAAGSLSGLGQGWAARVQAIASWERQPSGRPSAGRDGQPTPTRRVCCTICHGISII